MTSGMGEECARRAGWENQHGACSAEDCLSLNGYGCRCDRYHCGILYFSVGLISTPRPAPTGQIMVHIAPKHISGLQSVARSDSCSHRGRPLGPGPAIIHHHHPGGFWSRPRAPDKILVNAGYQNSGHNADPKSGGRSTYVVLQYKCLRYR